VFKVQKDDPCKMTVKVIETANTIKWDHYQEIVNSLAHCDDILRERYRDKWAGETNARLGFLSSNMIVKAL